MPPSAEIRTAAKTPKRKVPSHLIKEWVYDIPVYYKGYRDVLKKTKTPEEIMADGMFQAILKNWLHLLLGAHLDLQKYWILTGEVGSQLACRKMPRTTW